MKKNEAIRKALGLTYIGYDNCRQAHFNIWCSRYAELFCLPLEAMVKDDHLQNWYHDQWLKSVELPFYVDHQDYLEGGIEARGTLQDLFLTYPEDILERYPKSLFNDLKKRYETRKRLLNP